MIIKDRKKLIFDFDGTIVDSLDLLVKIYNQICHKYKCLPVDIKDREDLRQLKSQEILKIYKITFFKIPFLLIKIKKEFKKKILEVQIFEEMSIVLKKLKDRGFDLYILTSNSQENVEMFLQNNDLLNIFSSVYSSSNIFGKDKSINKLLKKENIDKADCIYIGDETRDIEAMKKVEIPIIAVSWGFNSEEALSKLGPHQVIRKPEELLTLL